MQPSWIGVTWIMSPDTLFRVATISSLKHYSYTVERPNDIELVSTLTPAEMSVWTCESVVMSGWESSGITTVDWLNHETLYVKFVRPGDMWQGSVA